MTLCPHVYSSSSQSKIGYCWYVRITTLPDRERKHRSELFDDLKRHICELQKICPASCFQPPLCGYIYAWRTSGEGLARIPNNRKWTVSLSATAYARGNLEAVPHPKDGSGGQGARTTATGCRLAAGKHSRRTRSHSSHTWSTPCTPLYASVLRKKIELE